MSRIEQQASYFVIAMKSKLGLINDELERFILALGLALDEQRSWDLIDGLEDLPTSMPSDEPLGSCLLTLLRLRNDISKSLDKFDQGYQPHAIVQHDDKDN